MNFYDANRFIDYVFLVLLVAFCVWLVFGTKSKEKKGWKRKWLLITVFTFLFLYFFWWAFTMGFVLIFSPFFHISFALFFSIALFYGKSVIEKASSFFEKPAFSVLLMICTIASASLFGNEILEASTEKIRSLVEIGLNYNPQSFEGCNLGRFLQVI